MIQHHIAKYNEEFNSSVRWNRSNEQYGWTDVTCKRCENIKQNYDKPTVQHRSCIISRSHESNTHVGSTGLSCIQRGHGEWWMVCYRGWWLKPPYWLTSASHESYTLVALFLWLGLNLHYVSPPPPAPNQNPWWVTIQYQKLQTKIPTQKISKTLILIIFQRLH